MSSAILDLSHVETFSGLSADDMALLESRLLPLTVARGEAIVNEGDAADALYVVVSGRFAVSVSGSADPVAEIGPGAPIGEIAFFAGGARTATVQAIRDSVVVRLTREDFDDIARFSPALTGAITAALARRLARETRRAAALSPQMSIRPKPRTIAVVPAGPNPIPPAFQSAFTAEAKRCDRTLILTAGTVGEAIGDADLSAQAATRALNALEREYETIIFVAGPNIDPWSEKALHQADEVLLVAATSGSPIGSSVALNTIEARAFELHAPNTRRLVLVHPQRHALQGTRHWLAQRSVQLHHHLALGSGDDMARLWRYLRGEAQGFVACGGGAYCAAHIGIYKACREKNVAMDFLGGASGGAAMAAAFAQDLEPGEIDNRVHRMFIEGKAMSRYTVPRYSLLDHAHFDRHLIAEYGNTRIEDMWKPYFAVSADLSDYRVEVHRDGPVWEAVRASAAIPALLPPFYTGDGRMLVDGSVVSNVPIDIMHMLKSGPNIVVNFSPPSGERFSVDYARLPERRNLILRTLNPFKTSELPQAPSAGTWRSTISEASPWTSAQAPSASSRTGRSPRTTPAARPSSSAACRSANAPPGSLGGAGASPPRGS